MICQWCGGDAVEGTVCPKSLPCPHCGAEAGKSCLRPSGHRAHQLHTRRIWAAEELDRLDFEKIKRHSLQTMALLDAS